MSDQNMKIYQIMAIIAKKAGGMQNVRCTKKDIANEIASRNKNLRGVDVSQALMYFSAVEKRDPYFFYVVDEDEAHVKNIFWVNGRSRRAYERFSDVVTFDTAYATNQYCMPFAPFFGVNHHGHTIFFWCALLRDEGKVNFEWLFNTWMKAMHGKYPGAIITDQDPAMKAAIEKVFPNTAHRCCQWHVMRKARDHLGVLYGQIDGFQEDLFSCIIGSLTIEQFESNWREMVSRYNLENNSHLKLMFSTRSRWIPAYFCGTFFANMSTSQRSEGMNSVLKNWVDSHTSIYKFVVQFDKMLQTVYARESEEDFRILNEEAAFWSPYPIEKEARNVYTTNVFSSFKNRLRQSCEYNATAIEHYVSYDVKRMQSSVTRNYFPDSYKVEIDMTNSKVFCECKGLEFQDMLCAHALRVMQVVGIRDHLPNNYVLKRWTKNANEGVNISNVCTNMEQTVESQAGRYSELHALMLRIIVKSSKIPSAHELASQNMRELDDELDEHSETYVSEMEEENEPDVNVKFHDPPVSQCKGRRKPQRHKPPADANANANVKKRRTCSTCGKKEGHNFRTCPQRKKS